MVFTKSTIFSGCFLRIVHENGYIVVVFGHVLRANADALSLAVSLDYCIAVVCYLRVCASAEVFLNRRGRYDFVFGRCVMISRL